MKDKSNMSNILEDMYAFRKNVEKVQAEEKEKMI